MHGDVQTQVPFPLRNGLLQPAPSQHVLAEAQFQALLESAPDAMVIVDSTGRIVLTNSQAERLFGYQRSELVGQPVELLIPEDLRTRHEHHRAAYAAAPRTRPMGNGLDLVGRRKDGSTFPAEISLSAIPVASGNLVISVIRDVTERKRAAEILEQQVQQRTTHLNALLQFSQELLEARRLDAVLQRALNHAMSLAPEAECGAIYLYDPADDRLALRASVGFHTLPRLRLSLASVPVGLAFTTRQPQFTSSATELTSLVPEMTDTLQQDLLDLLDLQALPSGTLSLPLVAHQQAVGVLFLLRRTGSGGFAVEARATLEGLANLTAAAILEDRRAQEAAALSSRLMHLEQQQHAMAERVTTAEAAMLQAARLAAVGQLAASVAHEINNPLYAVRNALYLLEEDLPAEVRTSPFLRIAREQLARIAGIIERMRDFYRPNRGEMARCNLNVLLEETLALAGLNMRDAPINVIFAPAPDLADVFCNADQLRQVFLNLILNGIEAMPRGGTLTVRTAASPAAAVVDIQDTGIGMPEAIRTRLFEPFFTTKPSGTGLGLSISAHIVTQHGGQIEVESCEGRGSTFRIILPYQPGS